MRRGRDIKSASASLTLIVTLATERNLPSGKTVGNFEFHPAWHVLDQPPAKGLAGIGSVVPFVRGHDDERVVEELFEEELDNLLRDDEEFHQVADALMEEIQQTPVGA